MDLTITMTKGDFYAPPAVMQEARMTLSLRMLLCCAEITKSLQFRTGFKSGEIFRKYLWYLLRERKFDQEAVNDIVYLKSTLNLNDDQACC